MAEAVPCNAGAGGNPGGVVASSVIPKKYHPPSRGKLAPAKMDCTGHGPLLRGPRWRVRDGKKRDPRLPRGTDFHLGGGWRVTILRYVNRYGSTGRDGRKLRRRCVADDRSKSILC